MSICLSKVVIPKKREKQMIFQVSFALEKQTSILKKIANPNTSSHYLLRADWFRGKDSITTPLSNTKRSPDVRIACLH